jgi:hypothetical protein
MHDSDPLRIGIHSSCSLELIAKSASQPAMFFSHNKSANITFSYDLSVKRVQCPTLIYIKSEYLDSGNLINIGYIYVSSVRFVSTSILGTRTYVSPFPFSSIVLFIYYKSYFFFVASPLIDIYCCSFHFHFLIFSSLLIIY